MNTIIDDLPFVSYSQSRIERYRKKGYWLGETLIDFLKNCTRKYANNIALVDNDRELTYAELFKYSSIFGSYLIREGIRKDDFILVQSPNVLEYFIIVFGIFYAGARPIFCLNGYGEYEVENIINTSNAIGYIKYSNGKSNECSHIHFMNKCNSLKYAEVIDSSLISKLMREKNNGILDYNDVSPESVAFLLLSGGTTDIPKLIPRTHDDYLYSVRESAKICGLNEKTKILLVLPVSHNFPMSSPGFLGVFYAGATVYLSESSAPEICFPLIEKHKINQVSLVPSLVILWLNSSCYDQFDLSSLNIVQVGGAKFLPEIARDFINKFNVTLQQVYGMAEGLVNYTRLDDDLETILYTQGKKISQDDKILIVNENGEELKLGEIGQIITQGPYTINSYYNLPSVNKIAFTDDGYYKTGDIGYLDSNLNIVVTGRLKEIINKGGEKISPSEIESLLIDHPSIKDVSVVGIPDYLLGEKIKAYIITFSEEILTLQQIRKYLLDKSVVWHKLPDQIEVVSSFEYTLVGKINKKAIR